MSKLLQFVSEDNGTLSGQRLAYLAWNLAVCLVWTYCSLKAGQPVALEPESLVGLAIAQAGKVGQKLAEAKKV